MSATVRHDDQRATGDAARAAARGRRSTATVGTCAAGADAVGMARNGNGNGDEAARQHHPLLELLESDCRNRLARIAGSNPTTLTVLWGPQADLVEAAATTLGRFWVPQRDRDVDLAVLAPEGRWDMAQLRESVLGACRVMPLQRRVVVVLAVTDLDRAGYDLLLKTVEEPPEGTVFVFTTTSMSALPRTIAGRSGHDVGIRAVGGDARRQVLARQGWREQDAARAVALNVPASWIAVLSSSPELLEQFDTLERIIDSAGTPARRAGAAVAALEELTRGGADVFGTGDRGQRAARRSAVEWVLQQMGHRVRTDLANNGDPYDAEQRLRTLSRARDQLAGNASLPLVLAVLLGASDYHDLTAPKATPWPVAST